MEKNIETSSPATIRKMWQTPWKYKEGFFVAFVLVVLGTSLELATGGAGVGTVVWPYNAYLLIAFADIILILHFIFRKRNLIKWLSSIPASVSAIVLYTFLTLFMGLILQEGNDSHFAKITGLSHLTTSWTFAFAQAYFLLSLGLVALRRTFPFKKKNIGFMLNHIGLWITIAAATMGSGDLQRLHMVLTENQDYTNQAFDGKQQTYDLPVSLKLHDFVIEEYPPKLALINRDFSFVFDDNQSIFAADEDSTLHIKNWAITIDTYYPDAVPMDSVFIPQEINGAPPAVMITATNTVSQKTVKGWVSSGSYMIPQKLLQLDGNYALAMLKPQTKKYSSIISYATISGETGNATIEVNKPISLEGWKIYQYSYDDELGKWSQTSIVEVIRDPWLPLVYIGIFLMLAGAVYIFWIGIDFKLSE